MSEEEPTVANPFKEGTDSWQIFERLRSGPATNEQLRDGLNSGPSLVSLVVGKLRKDGIAVANDTSEGRKRYWLGEGGDPIPERKPRKRKAEPVQPTETTVASTNGSGNYQLEVQPTVGLGANVSWKIQFTQLGRTFEGVVEGSSESAVVRALQADDGGFAATLSDASGEFVVRELRPV